MIIIHISGCLNIINLFFLYSIDLSKLKMGRKKGKVREYFAYDVLDMYCQWQARQVGNDVESLKFQIPAMIKWIFLQSVLVCIHQKLASYWFSSNDEFSSNSLYIDFQ